jgi:hypothetical protein
MRHPRRLWLNKGPSARSSWIEHEAAGGIAERKAESDNPEQDDDQLQRQ